MATTTLIVNANRLFNTAFLQVSLGSVALDAQVTEKFVLPGTFGQLILEHVMFYITGLSAAYVAPAPAYDGVLCEIQSADGSTVIDSVGTSRFVHSGTSSARPTLSAYFDMYNRTIVRQQDRVVVSAPVIAGAGATGTVGIYLRGKRIMTA